MSEHERGLRVRRTQTGVEIHRADSDRPIVTQNAQADRRPFLHPIVPPGGAVPVTEDEPSHHPWQHGLFVGLNDVNGHGFWTEGRVAASADADGSFHPQLTGQPTAQGDTASWSVETEYRDPSGAAILSEEQHWQLTDHGDRFDLDVVWSLTAKVPVRFGQHAYGGLFLRMPFREETGGSVVNSEGAQDRAAEGARARWVSVRMPVDGNAEEAFVVMMDHPRNLRHPVPWRVDDQLGVAPSACIVGEWSLAEGSTQTFRHRVSVFDRPVADEDVDGVWAAYSTTDRHNPGGTE